MKIVVVGSGKVGLALVKYLSEEGHDVTVIDNDRQVVDNVVNNYDVLGICGNGAIFNIQKEAGVDKADLLVSATSSDELNIVCCMIGKKIGAKHTIARVRNPDYSGQLHFIQELGISMIVNPELEAANEISRILRFPSAVKIDAFSKGRVELAEFIIKEGNPLVDLPVSAIFEEYKREILVCSVERGDRVFIPGGDFIIKEGDKVSLTATRRELSLFLKQLGIYKNGIKKVLIIGGGKIGYYLASQLIDTGFRVTIIEIDHDRCIELSDALPKAEIFCGDGTSKEVLAEHDLESMDAVVCLTSIDEENIITSLYASSLNIGKTVTKINRVSSDMLSRIGVESAISPKRVAAYRILNYIRALQNSEGCSFQTLYELVEGKVEAVEFHIEDEAEYTGIPFRDLFLKKDLLICCLMRKNKIIFPRGSDMMMPGDNVIVVTGNRRIHSLNDILA